MHGGERGNLENSGNCFISFGILPSDFGSRHMTVGAMSLRHDEWGSSLGVGRLWSLTNIGLGWTTGPRGSFESQRNGPF